MAELIGAIATSLAAAQPDDRPLWRWLARVAVQSLEYRPPVQGNTFALWAIPGVLLFGGAVAVFFIVCGRNRKLAAQRDQGSA